MHTRVIFGVRLFSHHYLIVDKSALLLTPKSRIRVLAGSQVHRYVYFSHREVLRLVYLILPGGTCGFVSTQGKRVGLFPCSIFPITAGFTRPSFLPAPLCGGVHIRPTIFSSKDGVLVTRVPLFKVGGSFGNVFPVVIRDLINVKKPDGVVIRVFRLYSGWPGLSRSVPIWYLLT